MTAPAAGPTPADRARTRHRARPRVAIATADLTGLGVEDEDLDRPELEAAFAGRAHLEFARWDDPSVDWQAFDVVLLRSTWDYTRRLEEFLRWVDSTASVTLLLNDPGTVRWNSDKTYLGELAAAGVPVVPTVYATSPDDVGRALREVTRLRGAAHLNGGGPSAAAAEVVVKPSVSAGSYLTGRFGPDDPGARRLAEEILAAGRAVMIQPFVASVAERGEVAVVVFGGEPSHAARKGPILASGGGFVGGSYVEDVTPVDLDARLVAAATGVLDAHARLHPSSTPLYARVDLIEGDDGELRLLELELIEPSLFLPCAPGAAARFADAVLARLG